MSEEPRKPVHRSLEAEMEEAAREEGEKDASIKRLTLDQIHAQCPKGDENCWIQIKRTYFTHSFTSEDSCIVFHEPGEFQATVIHLSLNHSYYCEKVNGSRFYKMVVNHKIYVRGFFVIAFEQEGSDKIEKLMLIYDVVAHPNGSLDRKHLMLHEHCTFEKLETK